jgi:molybdopterin-containing oxidoreductase family membrane subunit
VLAPGHTIGSVTDKISSLVLARPYNWRWFTGMGIGFALTMLLMVAVGNLFYNGIGIWGVARPVMWGFAIVNFVWWIGIGHAGTLISAILLLLKQEWRTSINRFAEAMTLFAVACARGCFTGWPRIRTRWRSGPSGAAPSCGTCSRSRPMPPCRSCSGMSA